MDDLFLALFLLTIPVLVVGLIKPAWLKMPNRKVVSLGLGAAMVVFFALFINLSDNTATPATVASTETTPSVPITGAQPANISNSAHTPAQPDLETTLKGIVEKASGTTNVTYRSILIENDDDSDRPAGSKMLTVKVNVTSFYNKSSFTKDSGKLTAQLFQASIPSSLKPYDVFIWFYGETTDRYGNKKDDVITVYSIDRVTFEKINWSNFDPAGLCDFLKQEEKVSGLGTGPSCTIMPSVQ